MGYPGWHHASLPDKGRQASVWPTIRPEWWVVDPDFGIAVVYGSENAIGKDKSSSRFSIVYSGCRCLPQYPLLRIDRRSNNRFLTLFGLLHAPQLNRIRGTRIQLSGVNRTDLSCAYHVWGYQKYKLVILHNVVICAKNVF